MEIRRETVSRYITPLREGGSLPALAEANDGFKYVVKFRGAGHGPKALIAEFIGGEVARALGFRVPEIVLLDIDEDFGRTEGDEEIQDLLKAGNAGSACNCTLTKRNWAHTVVHIPEKRFSHNSRDSRRFAKGNLKGDQWHFSR